jgi:hypothetical protein
VSRDVSLAEPLADACSAVAFDDASLLTAAGAAAGAAAIAATDAATGVGVGGAIGSLAFALAGKSTDPTIGNSPSSLASPTVANDCDGDGTADAHTPICYFLPSSNYLGTSSFEFLNLRNFSGLILVGDCVVTCSQRATSWSACQ